ncbi:hypothetical protein X943_001352 [Babesia divergens]|uniref:Uncharacterized protein n=1 Tax=Babesia divergens TaxID=32595 RepID=A0AAD9G6V2_BABDI|nr:hypothetical protein X943_001352 [Babesia divergens]
MAINYPKTLAITGAVGLVAYFIYYLLQDDDKDEEYDIYKKDYDLPGSMAANTAVEKMSRNDVLDLLAKIAASQEKAKTLLAKLVKSIISNNFADSMEDIYNRIVKDVPVDPLKARGLTLFDLDYLVERYQSDMAVREHIMKMIHIPPAESEGDDVDIGPDEIVIVYEFMLDELQRLQAAEKPLAAQPNVNANAASLTVQAIVAAKVQNKFGYTSVQIDRAITKNQAELGMNTRFARLAMQIQSEMTEITG